MLDKSLHQPQVSRRRSAETVQSVRRASAILTVLAERPEQSAAEVAAAVGLHSSTCYHLLNTLEAESLVLRRDDARYVLGPHVLFLAGRCDVGFLQTRVLLKELDDLNLRSGETAYLVGWQHGTIVVLGARPGTEAVIVGDTRLGVREHAHAKASGKAILAFSPPERRARFLRQTPLEALTAHTVVEPGALLAQLDEVRERGYSVEIEEYALGVACLAAPILYRDGDAVGALAISVPLERFRRSRRALEAEIVRAGRRGSEIVSQTGAGTP